MPENNHLKRVLLVDDDPLVRKSFSRIFVDEAYLLQVADCARQALVILEQGEAIDVIVADFLMPGKDGVELLQQVKQRWPEMTRILFTASSENSRVRNSLHSGLAQGLIEKPWDQDHVLKVMSTI